MTRTDAAANPSTAWKEYPLAPDEPVLFEGFAREIMAQQKEVAAKSDGKLLRGFHAKLHAGLRAEFTVQADLPPHACHGVFATPKTYPALVRFSNGEPGIHADRHREPRGIAIKLIGVPGRKLLPGQEDAVTQDFLATSHSVTSAVRNPRFMQFIGPSAATACRALPRCEPFRGSSASESLIRTVVLSHVRSMVTEHFSAPRRLRPYAVKFMVRPADGTAAAQFRSRKLPAAEPGRLRSADIKLDTLVQFYVGDIHTPIETPRSPGFAMADNGAVRIFKCDLDDPQTNALSGVGQPTVLQSMACDGGPSSAGQRDAPPVRWSMTRAPVCGCTVPSRPGAAHRG